MNVKPKKIDNSQDVISKTKREDWAVAAQQISKASDDELLLDFVGDNEEEWFNFSRTN